MRLFKCIHHAEKGYNMTDLLDANCLTVKLYITICVSELLFHVPVFPITAVTLLDLRQ